MKQFAAKVHEAGYRWPFPLIQYASGSNQYVAVIGRTLPVHDIGNRDSPPRCDFITPCLGHAMRKIHVFSDIVFLGHAVPVRQYLRARSVKLRPGGIGVPGQLVSMGWYIYADKS